MLQKIVLFSMGMLIAASAAASDFSFYATYYRIVGPDPSGLASIEGSVMSGDGQRLAVWGRGPDRKLQVWTLAADGSLRSSVPIPPALDGIWDATINRDGACVFFRHHWDKAIYKLQVGNLQKIFDADNYKEVGDISQIQTTADGNWIYFLDARRFVWRVSQSGGPPQQVLSLDSVQHDGGKAANLGRFCISDDGQSLLFRVDGFWDRNGAFHLKHELFIKTAGGIRQITNDTTNVLKEQFTISGDGQVAVYEAGPPQNHIERIDLGEGTVRVLEQAPGVEAMVLDRDGSQLFYFNQRTNGRRVRTDGAGGTDLFPAWNIGAIALNAPWSLSISDGGERISFRAQPGVYVGDFGRDRTATSVPAIDTVRFDPPLHPETSAETLVKAQISDPDGPGDIIRTHTHPVVAGTILPMQGQPPLVISRPVNDIGAVPDSTAGDGTFTTMVRTNASAPWPAGINVRIAAADRNQNVVVADVALSGTSGSPAAPEAVALSSEQQQTVDLLGWPDAFSVWRIVEDGEYRRHEAWSWLDSGLTYVFVDGRFRFVEPASGLPPDMAPTRLRPNQVKLSITPERARARFSRSRWEPVWLLDLQEGMNGFSADGLVLAFYEGQLVAAQTWSPSAGAVRNPP